MHPGTRKSHRKSLLNAEHCSFPWPPLLLGWDFFFAWISKEKHSTHAVLLHVYFYVNTCICLALAPNSYICWTILTKHWDTNESENIWGNYMAIDNRQTDRESRSVLMIPGRQRCEMTDSLVDISESTQGSQDSLAHHPRNNQTCFKGLFPPHRLVPKWEPPSRPLDPRAGGTPPASASLAPLFWPPWGGGRGASRYAGTLIQYAASSGTHFQQISADLLLPCAKPAPQLLAAQQNLNIPNLAIMD